MVERRIDELPAADRLCLNTSRIEAVNAKGNSFVGTGFVFLFCHESKQSMPALVTNWHVVKDAVSVSFFLTSQDSTATPGTKGRLRRITVPSAQLHWIRHPSSEVDLAVLPLAPLLRQGERDGHPFMFSAISPEIIPKSSDLDELSAIENVVMIGYPTGLWDHVNNLPIVRSGITATSLKNDYQGRQEFVIDAACFPGSSGSPVFLYADGVLKVEGDVVVGTRVMFLGVLYGGPQISIKGELKVVSAELDMKPIALTEIPVNLGYVIKSSRLLEFNDVLRKLAPKQATS